jgi:hypothetical protein
MEHDSMDEIPDAFWEALSRLNLDLPEPLEREGWRMVLPEGLTDVLEVAETEVTFGHMVHLVGDPTSTSVAYSHVMLQHGLLGMRVYFPARFVPGGVGIPAFVVGFKNMPQVRRMYDVERVLSRLHDVHDVRMAYGRAVSAATVQQATRALSGLARIEALPFRLVPLSAA